jgi:hypothetical protein
MNINNLTTLLNEYKNGNGHIEYLIDDEMTSENHDNYTIQNSLIVYEYIHNINEIVIELINNNIEFTHHIDDSDMSYLLINKTLFTN